MYRKLLIINIISFLLFSNCYSQDRKQLSKNGFVAKTDYLTEIPLRYIDGQIFIEVTITNKKYNFLFDTGSEISMISKEITDEIDFKSIKEITVSGSSIAAEKVKVIELPKISIATIDFENTNGMLKDLSFIKKNYDNLKISGIIGSNLMRKANWQIDYQKEIIKISDKIDKFSVSETAHLIKMDKKDWGIGYLNLSINSKKHKFIFDSGSSGKFTMGLDFLKNFNAKKIEVVKPDLKYKVLAETVTLGKVKLSNQNISLEKGVSSLIGNRFFEAYILTIDWKNNTLYLDPQNEKL